MKREYDSGTSSQAVFFTGKEVECTPAHGMDTLFIVGVHPIESIENLLKVYTHIKHVFFGANHSFNPKTYDEHRAWDDMISYFLNEGYLCSLDIPLDQVADFHDYSIPEFNNFIPQIRVPIPYIKLWNYNAMIKIDDKDFNASNPGVWTHPLHKLMDRDCFTAWSEYSDDTIVNMDKDDEHN